MKKLIAFAVVFALVAGVAAFADDGKVNEGITISGSAGATFVPFILGGPVYDGYGAFDLVDPAQKVGGWNTAGTNYDLVRIPEGRSEIFTGLYGYGVSVSVNGSSEYAGFSLGINQGGSIGGSFWVSPLGSNQLKFSFGNNNLAITSNDLVPGLGISLKLPGLVDVGSYIDATRNDAVASTFADAWRQVQVGVSYAIPDIGSFNVGYNGGWAEPINFNTPTDYQVRYLYKMSLPTIEGSPHTDGNYSTGGPGGPGENDYKDPVPGIWGRLNKGPDNFDNSIPWGSANFTAGFNLSALQSIGLGLGINATLYLPQSGEFKSPVPGQDVSMKRENTGWVNLGLNVSYGSGDFSIGFNFGAKNLGKSTTLTVAGAYADGSLLNTLTSGDDTITPLAGTKKEDSKVEMSIGLTPRYVIDGTTIGVNVNVDFTSESKTTQSGFTTDTNNWEKTGLDSTAQYKFGAFVKFKPFGKATLQVGIDVATPKLLTANKERNGVLNTQPIPDKMNDGDGNNNNSRFFISIPVSFSVSF
jgi:hypothetical protein